MISPEARQGLQQAIEGRAAKPDALLNLEHAERRLVGREALQDGDGAVDRADRRARSFVFLIVDGHERCFPSIVCGLIAVSIRWTLISIPVDSDLEFL